MLLIIAMLNICAYSKLVQICNVFSAQQTIISENAFEKSSNFYEKKFIFTYNKYIYIKNLRCNFNSNTL